MTNRGTMGSGWKDRRAAADAAREKRAADYQDSERAAIRQERARIYAEAAERDAAAAAEAAEARLRLRVSCPCCDGNPDGVLVSKAEKILRAWASPLLNPNPDSWNVGHLNAVAVGADTGAVIVPEGLHYPRPVARTVHTEAAEILAEPATITPKEPVISTKPRRRPTAAEIFAAGGDEGALDLTD